MDGMHKMLVSLYHACYKCREHLQSPVTINMVRCNLSIYSKEIAKAKEEDGVLDMMSIPLDWLSILNCYVRMARWSSPKFFKTEQLVCTIIACRILDTLVFMKCYM